MQDAAEEPGEGNQLLVGLFIPIWPTVQRRIFQNLCRIRIGGQCKSQDNALLPKQRYWNFWRWLLEPVATAWWELLRLISVHICIPLPRHSPETFIVLVTLTPKSALDECQRLRADLRNIQPLKRWPSSAKVRHKLWLMGPTIPNGELLIGEGQTPLVIQIQIWIVIFFRKTVPLNTWADCGPLDAEYWIRVRF